MYKPVKIEKENEHPRHLFDTESVKFTDFRITGSGFWKEYLESKIDMNTQYINQCQKLFYKYKKKIDKRYTERDDLFWTNSMKQELNRDEAMTKLLEANNKSYLKFSMELTKLDSWVSDKEADFKKDMEEFSKMEIELGYYRKELTTRKEKLYERLDRIESLLSEDEEQNTDKIQELTMKLESAAANYDTMLLKEFRKRPDVFKKSLEIEHSQKDRERERLEFLVNKWKGCVKSLQDNVSKYADHLSEVKAIMYMDGINIDLMVNKSYERKDADYSDYETSSSIVSQRPNVEQLIRKRKGRQCLTTDDGFDADFDEKYNSTLNGENEIKNDKSTDSKEIQKKCVDVPDTSNTVKQEDETPKEFSPYKATITKHYKKSREGEMSIKRGDKVKVLDRPNHFGLVFIEKKTMFNLKKKRGLVPFSHLLPLDTK